MLILPFSLHLWLHKSSLSFDGMINLRLIFCIALTLKMRKEHLEYIKGTCCLEEIHSEKYFWFLYNHQPVLSFK